MNFDLFVIGGGSGGVRAARVASSNGLKVALAEGLDLGGTCVNRGCIPKKLYSYASHFKEEVSLMNSFGWSVKNVDLNWEKLVRNKKKELKRLNEIYKNLLEKSGVKIFKEWATIEDNQTIKLSNDKIIKTKKILIAVGGEPTPPNFPGSDLIINSDDAFDLKNLPESILIIGGGYIAVEFASIFNGFGVDVTICLRGDKILRGFDDESIFFLKNEIEKKGVKFLVNTNIQSLKKHKNKIHVNFFDKTKKYDQVMAAIGRKPKTNGLGIENTKIKLSKNGSIIVDDYFQTSEKSIYAIGDVIDRVQLTPVAINEAMILVYNIINKKKSLLNYNNIPTAVFSDPNMATIGFTEEEAKVKFKNIDIYSSEFKSLKLSLSKSKEKTFIKMIVDSNSEKVIGLHYIGHEAAEIIQGFSVAIVNGLKKSDFDNTVGIHPSSAEEIVTLREKRKKL